MPHLEIRAYFRIPLGGAIRVVIPSCVARRVRNRRRRRTELRGESRFWPRTRLSLVFAADKVDSMLFLAVIARIARPRESESNDLLALSRVGHAGLTVITLVYVLVILWRQ